MPRWGIIAATAMCLVGCKRDADENSLPSAAPEPKTGLSIGDVHIEAKQLFAIGTAGESAWRMVVATGGVDCDKLKNTYPDRPGPAGVMLDFWLMQPLESDGSAGRWSFRSAYLTDDGGGRGLTTRGAQLDDLLEAPDQIIVKGLELACQDRDGKMVQLTGPVTAKSCGRVERDEESRPQEELSLRIAGQPYAINGASVRPHGDQFFLRLTRAPHRCESVFTEGYDFYLDIALKGEPPKVQFAALLGDIFPADPSGSKGKESLKLDIDGPLTGDGDVTISIDGTLDVGGYPTVLAGKLAARRCTPLSNQATTPIGQDTPVPPSPQ